MTAKKATKRARKAKTANLVLDEVTTPKAARGRPRKEAGAKPKRARKGGGAAAIERAFKMGRALGRLEASA